MVQTAAQLANLRPENSLAHGVYARDGALMRCDRCPVAGTCEDRTEGGVCELERRYVEHRRDQLEDLPFIDVILDGPALSVLICQEVRIMRAARYLAAAGEMLPGVEQGYAELCPLAKDVHGLVNSWSRNLEKLGLTPLARKLLAPENVEAPWGEPEWFEAGQPRGRYRDS